MFKKKVGEFLTQVSKSKSTFFFLARFHLPSIFFSISTMETTTTAKFTREQAACMFYGEIINAKNERECEKRLNNLVNVNICYLEDTPTEPFMLAKVRIESSPDRYKRYPRTTPFIDAVSFTNGMNSTVQQRDVQSSTRFCFL